MDVDAALKMLFSEQIVLMMLESKLRPPTTATVSQKSTTECEPPRQEMMMGSVL